MDTFKGSYSLIHFKTLFNTNTVTVNSIITTIVICLLHNHYHPSLDINNNIYPAMVHHNQYKVHF